MIREKEIEKIIKYQNLKRELKRLWSLKKVEVVPVVVGALECISKGFSGWMDTLGINLNVGMVVARTTGVSRHKELPV